MGTTPLLVAENYTKKAVETREKIQALNAKYLAQYINETYNITIAPQAIDPDLGFEVLPKKYTSLYQNDDEFIFIVQNPSQQTREEKVEIQVPYHNYTVLAIDNGTVSEVKNIDKFLPRVWKNSNNTLVPSYF